MRLLLPCCALLLVACDSHLNLVAPDWDLNRMVEQPYGRAYGHNPFFADGRVMRQPPEGTVPFEEELGPPGLVDGRDESGWVERIPMPVDRALLARGREHYEITCAACHGISGTGETPVARSMELVRPPSLLSEAIRALPPGRVYQVVQRGYGMMPGYGWQLDVRERWAVTAYVRAQQLSRAVALSSLPAPVRRRAEEVLR